MTNLECAVAVLAAHREARNWTDEAVAADMVAQLGLDPAGNAAKAKPVVPPGVTEDEVLAHEAAAKEAVEKAKASREALEAQRAADKPAIERPTQAPNRPMSAEPGAVPPVVAPHAPMVFAQPHPILPVAPPERVVPRP